MKKPTIAQIKKFNKFLEEYENGENVIIIDECDKDEFQYRCNDYIKKGFDLRSCSSHTVHYPGEDSGIRHCAIMVKVGIGEWFETP